MLTMGTPLPQAAGDLENESDIGSTSQAELNARAAFIFEEQRRRVYERTDRLFAGLMILQWLGGVVAALVISPRAWTGTYSETHIHVWAAVFLGGIITSFPVFLALRYPGRAMTRHVIAASQTLMSALLIHLTGGRIETHFHVFGSLAFLAFYRDWRVLITASAVVAIDHALRGIYWPQSVYGVVTVEPWRWVEHAWWVVFEDVFLIISIRQSVKEMWSIACRQAELEKMNLLVEAKVVERTAELHKEMTQRELAEEEISRKNADLETLLHVTSHDLKEPLRAIEGFTRVLDERYGERLETDGQDYLRRVSAAGKRMTRLLDDIATLSRVRRMDEPKDEVGLDTIVSQVLKRLELKIRDTRARIDVQEPLPRLKVNNTWVTQAVYNLVLNALKFTHNGEPPEIEIAPYQANGEVGIAVRDRGPGIAPEHKDRVFQLFQRAVGREVEGTGAGLSIVREVASRHGGRVWVQDRKGGGSEFIFTCGKSGYLEENNRAT